MNPLVGAASCCLSPFALCDVLFAASRCPSTPSNQRTIKLLRNPKTHSKVCRAAECMPRHSFHSQGSGRSLGSSAAVAAAFVPSAAVQVPEVDSSQPTTQVRLSCSAMPLHNHRNLLPSHVFVPQVAVTLIDGKRERLTLNQSFTGGALHRCFCCLLKLSSPRSHHHHHLAPAQILSQSVTYTPAFPNSPRESPSRSLAECRPSHSPTIPRPLPPLGCSTLWCGRPRAEKVFRTASSLRRRVWRERSARGGLQP